MFTEFVLDCVDGIFDDGFRWRCSSGLSHLVEIPLQNGLIKQLFKTVWCYLFIIYASGGRRGYHWAKKIDYIMSCVSEETQRIYTTMWMSEYVCVWGSDRFWQQLYCHQTAAAATGCCNGVVFACVCVRDCITQKMATVHLTQIYFKHCQWLHSVLVLSGLVCVCCTF